MKHLIILISLAFYSQLFAQNIAGSESSLPIRRLVDLPTTGTPKSGDVGFDFELLTKGSLISRFEIGIFNNFSVGASFGAANFIGSGNIDFYKIPGFNAKFRFITETRRIPSIAIGFESQGKGEYVDSLDRYEMKSPGLFLSFSKNFKFLGYLSLYGNLNYSFENKREDDINFSIGVEKTVWKTITTVIEYNLALNDNSSDSFGRGRGYLSSGIIWSATNHVSISLYFRNLLNNSRLSKNPDRSLNIIYYTNLF